MQLQRKHEITLHLLHTGRIWISPSFTLIRTGARFDVPRSLVPLGQEVPVLLCNGAGSIISLSSAYKKAEKLRASDTLAYPPANEPLNDNITMGSWGVLPFENDDALDWVWELEDAENFAVLELALEEVALAEAEDNIEAPQAEEALAAAEVVAALLGKPLDDLPEPVDAFLELNRGKKPSADLVSLAVKAVRRVRKSSELKDLWEASEDAEKWEEAMDDLLSRLK